MPSPKESADIRLKSPICTVEEEVYNTVDPKVIA